MNLPYSASWQHRPAGHVSFVKQRMTENRARPVFQHAGAPCFAGGDDVLQLREHATQQDATLSVDNEVVHRQKLKQVQLHAQKARQLYPNFSSRHFGALVVLENGIEGMGTNIEASPRTTFCDLRYAIMNALNQSIAAESGKWADDSVIRPVRNPRIRTVYLVNSNLDKDPAPVPCSECQEWLSSRFCTADTQVISLEKDQHGQETIRSRTVKQMLPLHMDRSPTRFFSSKELKRLPIVVSDSAQPIWQAMGGERKALKTIRSLMSEAKQAFQEQPPTSHSRKEDAQAAAAVLFAPSMMVRRAGRFEWSGRWFEPPDLRAASAALESIRKQQARIRKLPGFLQFLFKSRLSEPHIQAMAYYGKDGQLPPIASLGKLARQSSLKDAMLITVENDVIQARAIQDVMPEMYRSGS